MTIFTSQATAVTVGFQSLGLGVVRWFLQNPHQRGTQRNPGTLEPWNHATLETWNPFGILGPWGSTLTSWNPVIENFGIHPGALEPCSPMEP